MSADQPDNSAADLAHVLIDFGRATANLEPIEQKVVDAAERIQHLLRQIQPKLDGQEQGRATEVLRSAVTVLTEYSKRTAAYTSSLTSILDQFEKTLDEDTPGS